MWSNTYIVTSGDQQRRKNENEATSKNGSSLCKELFQCF